MRTIFNSLFIVLFAVALFAQDDLAALQGRWVVTAAERSGKPMDALKGGVMTIDADAFDIRTASGTLLRGTIRVDTSKRPFEMDMLHADGERWEAIYSVEGDNLRLNYVEAGGKGPRPNVFTTSVNTEESGITLRRERRRP